MFSSRLMVGLLIPLIILGLGVWLVVSTDVDRGDVRVAGVKIGAANVEFTVKESRITEDEGARKLVVELEARSIGGTTANIDPFTFQLVLSLKANLKVEGAWGGTFRPMYYRSVCDTAPYSMTSLPPSAVRSYTLHFYGATLPRGDEWDNYYLNLEYYDMSSQIMFSKALNPEGK